MFLTLFFHLHIAFWAAFRVVFSLMYPHIFTFYIVITLIYSHGSVATQLSPAGPSQPISGVLLPWPLLCGHCNISDGVIEGEDLVSFTKCFDPLTSLETSQRGSHMLLSLSISLFLSFLHFALGSVKVVQPEHLSCKIIPFLKVRPVWIKILVPAALLRLAQFRLCRRWGLQGNAGQTLRSLVPLWSRICSDSCWAKQRKDPKVCGFNWQEHFEFHILFF